MHFEARNLPLVQSTLVADAPLDGSSDDHLARRKREIAVAAFKQSQYKIDIEGDLATILPVPVVNSNPTVLVMQTAKMRLCEDPQDAVAAA